MNSLKVSQLQNALWRVQLPSSEDDSKTRDATTPSSFLTSPAHLVVSAPIPDSWYGLCHGAPTVASLKIYCGTTRVMNHAGSALKTASQSSCMRAPPFQLSAALDVESDVTAMAQPGGPTPTNVYGGLCDGRQKIPPLYSLEAIRAFLRPLATLKGRVFVPVVARCVEALGKECSSDDPIASAFAARVTGGLEEESPEKKRWLEYLLQKELGAGALALAELALGADVDVLLVPSMHYFVSNLTGRTARARQPPQRCAQIRFSSFVGHAECPGARSLRIGSSNTVHVTYSGKCDLTIASLGAPESLAVDGRIETIPVAPKSKSQSPFVAVLEALEKAQAIAAHPGSRKKAGPLLQVYVDALDRFEAGSVGLKMLALLKATLDQIFCLEPPSAKPGASKKLEPHFPTPSRMLSNYL